MDVHHSADWWLGDLEHPWFKALEGAITEEWGVEPLRIREGGVSHHSFASSYSADVEFFLKYIRGLVDPVCAIFREGIQLPSPSSSDGTECGADCFCL